MKNITIHISGVPPWSPNILVKNMEEPSKQSLERGARLPIEAVHLLRIKSDQVAFSDNPDWPGLVILNCYLCSQELDGLETSIDHIQNVHVDSYNLEKEFPCAGMIIIVTILSSYNALSPRFNDSMPIFVSVYL